MQINEFMYAPGWPAAGQSAVIGDIAGVTAAHVEGVLWVGQDPEGEPGDGVQVSSRNGDIWIYVLAVIESGTDEKWIKKEINQRTQAALWNLLSIQAVSIQSELVYSDGVPPALARENRRAIPFS